VALFWVVVAPAVLAAWIGLLSEPRRARYIARRLAEKPDSLPPATVIVPVKGWDEGLRENLHALASLDYPDYELIVAAHSAADVPGGVLPARVRIVLAHGDDPDTGEKIQNLKAAVRAARTRSQIFAFADSDGRPSPGWLRALAAPLAEEHVGASTGYRWFTPEPAGCWPLIRSVWDAVAAGMLGPGNNKFAWGGAMAIRKDRFFELRLFDYWRNTVSDDYALTEAVHAAGLEIAYAPGALTPSFERPGMAAFFHWTRRQLIITRVYNRPMWRMGAAAHLIYCAAMAASATVLAQGRRTGAITLAAQ
jgi:cellulose synthase/poly-beta-1,6-N-acetylglucosamine synthase-like glycosyltransferase